MKCVSYTRVVPWKNAEFAMSVTEQNDMISSYIKGMKDCQLIHKYSDRKKNQTADEGFEQMIEDAMERKFECVVVASFYYCGYGFPIAKQMILDTLYAAGIRFVVVDESFDTDCISKNEVEAYFEEKRCEMHGDIIKNWRKSRGSSYVLTNSVSWGYERPNGKNHLIKDEAVSYYVAQVFQRIIKGEQYRCVADWLNAEGVDTPAVYRKKKQGKDTSSEINEWNASKVRGIVSSPVYTGVLVDTHKNIIASECHEPYISKEQFYFLRCNKSGRAKNNKIRADYRSPNPLAQRIFCGECGAAMSYKSIKGDISIVIETAKIRERDILRKSLRTRLTNWCFRH